jgi:GNAT superfamily N-acetyltransferase
VYNNAVLERDLAAAQRAEAIGTMETAYRDACVTRFAAWVHESDEAMRRDLEQRAYTLDEVTRAMGMRLDHIRVPRPDLEVRPATWSEHLRINGLQPDLLSELDTVAFHILAAPLDSENVTTAIAFDLGTDCGIFNVGTVQRARRRGLATALTATLLHDARERGCQTASLQSSAMAERATPPWVFVIWDGSSSTSRRSRDARKFRPRSLSSLTTPAGQITPVLRASRRSPPGRPDH